MYNQAYYYKNRKKLIAYSKQYYYKNRKKILERLKEKTIYKKKRCVFCNKIIEYFCFPKDFKIGNYNRRIFCKLQCQVKFRIKNRKELKEQLKVNKE